MYITIAILLIWEAMFGTANGCTCSSCAHMEIKENHQFTWNQIGSISKFVLGVDLFLDERIFLACSPTMIWIMIKRSAVL